MIFEYGNGRLELKNFLTGSKSVYISIVIPSLLRQVAIKSL